MIDLNSLLSWAALGGFTGLVTFVFVIWDRVIRNRPLVWVIAKRNGYKFFPYLHVTNVGRTDILIVGLGSTSHGYAVADSETATGFLRAAIMDQPLAVIAADEAQDFPLLHRDKEVRGRLRFSVRWRWASSTWLPQIPKHVFTSYEAIEHIMIARERAVSKD